MNLSLNTTTPFLRHNIKFVNNAMNNLIKRNWGCLTYKNHYCREAVVATIGNKNNASFKRFNSSVGKADDGYINTVYQSISNSTPVAYVQQSIVEIHNFTGLPWWASIIVTTILFRTVITLPLAIYQHKITARLEMILLEMPAIVKELQMETKVARRKFHWSEQQTRIMYNKSLRKQWNKLVVRDNCHPAKTFIVLWAQIPLWIFQSVALRNLINMLPDSTTLQAQIVATELTVGGFGWIPNLTDVDHSYILPISLGIINLAIIETQSMMRQKPSTRFNRIVTNVFRGVSILMVPVACTVPSALNVYWVISSCYGLVQNLVLVSPKIKRLVGIPKTPSELRDPYKHLWLRLKQRIGNEKTRTVQHDTERIEKK